MRHDERRSSMEQSVERRHRVAAAALFVVLATGVPASAAAVDLAARRDVEGSADHPMISRYPGAVIVHYLQRDYAFRLPAGKAVREDREWVPEESLDLDWSGAEEPPSTRVRLEEGRSSTPITIREPDARRRGVDWRAATGNGPRRRDLVFWVTGGRSGRRVGVLGDGPAPPSCVGRPLRLLRDILRGQGIERRMLCRGPL
jgi:hypothetical protein